MKNIAYAIIAAGALSCASACEANRAQEQPLEPIKARVEVQSESQLTRVQVVSAIGREPDAELQTTEGRLVLVWRFTKDFPELGTKCSAYVATCDEFRYQLGGIHLEENQIAQ